MDSAEIWLIRKHIRQDRIRTGLLLLKDCKTGLEKFLRPWIGYTTQDPWN